MSSTNPYNKNSTSQTESVIRLVKQVFRQLCLAHTHNWPELVPILVQGINQQRLYHTDTIGAQIFFSPYSFPNNLRLGNFMFPESVFNDHFDHLNLIFRRRKTLLSKRQKMDSIDYQVGNIVLATNVPSKQKEKN